MSQANPDDLAEVIANPSNHIMCATCWAARWEAKQPHKYKMPTPKGYQWFAISGQCCYCHDLTTDGIPYGSGNAREEVCGGDHRLWTECGRLAVSK